MKYAVIYARYSSERQNDQSIEGQLRICNKYAEDNGLTIVDTYIDRAMTGTNDQRAAFQQMLTDCERTVLWDIVLVYAIDRFGRNSIEIAVNKQRLKKHNKTLISATQRTSENIDGSKNLDGILLENMYIGLAEYYSAELSQKVKRGIFENHQKGLYHGGTLPYGYYTVDRKIHVDEEKADIVRSIFQQYAEGRGGNEIMDDLKIKGVLHRGRNFSTSTFYAMLRNKKYIGITECSDGVYTNLCPAIVPKPLFDEVQRRLALNKVGGNSVRAEFLLKGKCLCGQCGRTYQGESGTSRNGTVKFYYKCVKRKLENACDATIFQKDYLEKFVTDRTLLVFGNQENIERIADTVLQINKKRLHDKSLKKVLLEQREQSQKSLDNILKAIEAGILNATTKKRMDELEEDIAVINEKIAIEEYKEKNSLKKEQIVEYLVHQVRKTPKLMLYCLIQKVIIFKDKVDIYYNYMNTPNPDGFSPEINRDSLFIECSPVFGAGAPVFRDKIARFYPFFVFWAKIRQKIRSFFTVFRLFFCVLFTIFEYMHIFNRFMHNLLFFTVLTHNCIS